MHLLVNTLNTLQCIYTSKHYVVHDKYVELYMSIKSFLGKKAQEKSSWTKPTKQKTIEEIKLSEGFKGKVHNFSTSLLTPYIIPK